MAAREQYGSLTQTIQRRGQTGERTWVCAWAERKTVMPRIGQPFPGEPSLRCSEVRIEGLGKPTGPTSYEYAKIVAQYQTYQAIDSAPIENVEFAGEVLEVGEGRTWEGTGQVVEVPVGIYMPNILRSITLTMAQIPYGSIISCLGRVNSATFLGIWPERCLFEGASADSYYDYERQMYIYRVTFKFNIRPQSWNVVWRAGRQKRSADGVLLFDTNGQPIYETTGGWDRPRPALYQLADFNPLINLPPAPKPIPPPV